MPYPDSLRAYERGGSELLRFADNGCPRRCSRRPWSSSVRVQSSMAAVGGALPDLLFHSVSESPSGTNDLGAIVPPGNIKQRDHVFGSHPPCRSPPNLAMKSFAVS
jgi:hypothetical protein